MQSALALAGPTVCVTLVEVWAAIASTLSLQRSRLSISHRVQYWMAVFKFLRRSTAELSLQAKPKAELSLQRRPSQLCRGGRSTTAQEPGAGVGTHSGSVTTVTRVRPYKGLGCT